MNLPFKYQIILMMMKVIQFMITPRCIVIQYQNLKIE